jgi:hypothetical protein
MFVREHDTGGAQSLWLLQAVPHSWLRPSDRIRVTDMPTAFGGSLDLALEVSADASSIRIETEWRGLAVSPKAIRLRLHAPEGRRLRSVLVDGRVDSTGATGSIELATERAASHAIVAQFE